MILEIALVLLAHPVAAARAGQSYPAGRSLAHVTALVPDARTAADIGKAVFRPLFGDEAVKDSLPFTATLSEGVWRVVGTPPADTNMAWDPIYIYIAKTNGWVLEISRSPTLSKGARADLLDAMKALRHKQQHSTGRHLPSVRMTQE
jgi:hypothetical protein